MQGARIESQAAASRPTRKRLWPQVGQAKITAQAATLKQFGASPVGLNHMVGRVRSGDPNNVEAQAAQRY
jgi:CRISPR-associated protein Cas1